MITKNFRLNALANQYAAALYNHITATSGGDYFMIEAGGESVRVNILGGVKGMRDLVDGYALEAIKEHYQAAQWESIGIAYLSRCVDAGGLTDAGLEAWGDMTADMGATVAGGKNA
ncbi:hypothetical protein [Citrobacter portucalensis]|uniref:hypothetical protein n=1 Tax=Citrobacter portucalensis TaxID=1639133 RepID=UPI00292C223E|nr:hypothetical protein [Citrobacter portucalensis]MDV1609415.1 hypothetical protein [Citrobacter portucalensis]MEB0543555.1 hypothetical protein [Citrobacter portucalensis]